MNKVVSIIFIVLFSGSLAIAGQEKNHVHQLMKEFKNKHDVKILQKISFTEPRTAEEVKLLGTVITEQKWNAPLFIASMKSLSRIQNKKLDNSLIEILDAENRILNRAMAGNTEGRGQKELAAHARNAELIITKLAELKSASAVPVLKEYLKFDGLKFHASEALAQIGDTTTKAEIKHRAYKGEDINYAGAGASEAMDVIVDLKDRTKKDNWHKIAKQIILIRSPSTKAELKSLLTHEKFYVKKEAASALKKMVDQSDVSTILEMSESNDWYIRSDAVDMMKKIDDPQFYDILVNLLLNDPHPCPRLDAAKALGYKHLSDAVPALEDALEDSALEVRQEVFIALYVLTGKKYNFQGRNSQIDQLAERQSQNPTFY